MKILIIIGSFKMGGAERMSITIGEELGKRGHDVYYIVQRPIFEIPNTIDSNKITVLRKEKGNSFFYKISSLFIGTYKIGQKIKPDVVVGFSRFSSFLANFTLNKNIIATFDAYPYRMNKKQRMWADMVLNSGLIKKVILPSKGMVKALENVRPKFKRKYYYIPNCVDSTDILEKSKEKVEKFDFEYIVAMGRFSPQKNFELLIKAFSESKIKDKLKLVIIGEGAYRPTLEKLIAKLQLEEQVVLTGGLSNPFPVINKSKFFVNPSKFESFGNVILEALLLGKPVIATDCNYGPSDMIKNGYNGVLISDDNMQELVEKLNEWGDNELIVKELSQNAYSSALRFDIKNVGDMWQDLLNKTIK